MWPVALILAAITWGVLCFPEGNFLSPAWRRAGIAVMVVGAGCSLLSALWPVEYAATGVESVHPFDLPGAELAGRVWDIFAHPVYVLFQVMWVIAIAARWRSANGMLRTQLRLVAAAAATTSVALLIGLAVWKSPRLGLLTTALVPLTAGWVLMHHSLGRLVEQTRATGGLADLTSRENEVLEMMAQGLSNQAIAKRLHLSIKTVEPAVSSIFVKLQLPADTSTNRRVLAVLALLKR